MTYEVDVLLTRSRLQAMKALLHGKPRARRWRSVILWLERALWL